MMRGGRVVLAAAVLAALATTAAGCGSSDKGPGVATVGGGAPAASASASAAAGDRDEQLRQFAQCMRDNGVDVPDPQPGGGAFGGLAAGLNQNDPKFQAAFTACQAKLPNGGQPPKLDAAQVEQYRAFAQCMRDNGVDLPDPGPDGTLQFDRTNTNLLSDPAFQKGLNACRDKLTGLLPSARGGAS
jgi:hypothetical protein